MSTLDVHAWNAITLYVRNSRRQFIPFGSFREYYLNRCESSFGGKVKISLQPLNKYRNDFSRPLPSMRGVSSLKKQVVEQQLKCDMIFITKL